MRKKILYEWPNTLSRKKLKKKKKKLVIFTQKKVIFSPLFCTEILIGKLN